MVSRRTNGNPTELAIAKNALQHLARDHARVPMQWDESKHGGFTTGKPWMRANDDYALCNAKQQSGDKSSVLGFWKQMLALRRAHSDLFVYGNFDLVGAEDENLFAFTKQWHGSKAFVVCNFSKMEQQFEIPDATAKSQLLCGSMSNAQSNVLQPFEGRVYLL